MDIQTCLEDPDPSTFLENAAESLRRFNHATIAGNLDPWAVYEALGRLAETALRMPQAIEQLATSLRREGAGSRFDADLTAVRHAAVAMHEALAAAHSGLGELTLSGRPPLPAVGSTARRRDSYPTRRPLRFRQGR